MKQIVFVCLFFICGIHLSAQVKADSCTMKISLLTCTPGTDLYSLFGHTAIRVEDPARGMDIVYNYGTFDYNDPSFYFHFTRGIMNYSISADEYKNFMQEYEYEHRGVVAQVLNLNCTQKYQLYESLRKNTLEENRLYAYHFHTDNCTTRAGRIIESNTGGIFTYKNILPVPGPSFRDMIHEYLDRQKQYWPEFGIDICLGKNLDIKPTNIEAIHFLPDYLFRGMDSANTGNSPVVIDKQILLPDPGAPVLPEGLTPLSFFQLLFLVVIILFIFRAKPAIAKTLRVFDYIFFTWLGLVGLVLTYLWLGRVDDVCRNNINILWALPTHFAVVFFMHRKSSWVKFYFLVTAILVIILLIGFPWWMQRMNRAVLPVLGIILFRSLFFFKSRNYEKKSVVPR